MEIVHRTGHQPVQMTFGTLGCGECFRFPNGEAVYIVTSSPHGCFATLLSTGVSYPKPYNQPVISVRAKVVILD